MVEIGGRMGPVYQGRVRYQIRRVVGPCDRCFQRTIASQLDEGGSGDTSLDVQELGGNALKSGNILLGRRALGQLANGDCDEASK